MLETPKSLSPTARVLMGPGPSPTAPSVYEALAKPTLGHLDPEFLEVMDEIRDMQRAVMGTENELTMPMSGTGSSGMETCIVNLIEPGDKVLVGVNGVFGTRMVDVARRAGAQVTEAQSEWGRALDAELLREAAGGEQHKLVCVVHAETSTGVLQEVGPVREVADELGAMLLLDCVTSMGGLRVSLDEWGVDAAYAGIHLQYGPDYLIPTPFDPRLIVAVPKAVAQAAMDSGVAQKPIEDMEAYESELSARLNPIIGNLQATLDQVRAKPRRVVFAEGEEEKSIRAAHAFWNAGYGTPILVGREERVRDTMKTLGLGNIDGLEIHNARLSDRNADYAEYLYTRLQRKGSLKRDCQRLVNQDRNFFAACMVATGDADAMVTGLTRNFHAAMHNIASVIEPAPGARVMGLSMIIDRGRTLFVADTVVAESPDPRALADIARQSAAEARRFGHEPRVALISFANFGHPALPRAELVREAVQILDKEGADFEYDGEMAVDVALNKDLLANYPFCRLSDTANVLVMPGLHSAQISMKLLASVSGATVLGPLIKGLSKPIQVVPMGSTVADMVTLAALTAHEACD